MNWHSMTASQATEKLNCRADSGLSPAEAERRSEEYGKNKFDNKGHKSAAAVFFSQFTDFMTITLIITAAVSFAVSLSSGDGGYIDSVIILMIVFMNAVLGALQEVRAQNAIEALQAIASPTATVKRGGRVQDVPAETVTVGDIILVKTGDIVPADCRLISAHSLQAQESAITGESVPTSKNANAVLPENTPTGDRVNMLLGGSGITYGRGTAIVTEIGMNTAMGKIASMLNERKDDSTPLQKRLAQTGKLLGLGALVLCAVIFIMGIFSGNAPFEMFMTSISLAVAAIPEGLPAVVTIMLATGVKRLVKLGAITRTLPSVETLGSATVICSDKTGTLTQNKMTVKEVYPNEDRVLSLAAICCNADETIGEPTERAIIKEASARGIDANLLRRDNTRIRECPFDSDRKLMTVVVKHGGGYRIITKGAPDVLLGVCTDIRSKNGAVPLTADLRGMVERRNSQMTAKAYRVIGVAYRDISSVSGVSDSSLERGLTFAGLIGMMDPPRPEAADAVKQCKAAGIKPVMITGDHIETAKAVAQELGILQNGSYALSGAQLDEMSDSELKKAVKNCSVFARVTPEHKVRIVKAYKSLGETVAMTGDGANDAPALKAADIGCAMGLTGTDVAKSAADMILTDDNFSTIVRAVRQGRGIFDNIRKAIHFLLSSNIGEILTIFAAILFKMPSPLAAIQLLWINLVTDSLPALALGFEPVDKDIMRRPPRTAGKSFFSDGLWSKIATEGMMIGSLALLSFTIGRMYDFFDTPTTGMTFCFAVLGLSQLIHAFNMRSDRSLFDIGPFSNPHMLAAFAVCCALQVSVIQIPKLAAVFKVCPLTATQWLIVAALSAAPLAIMELQKAVNRARR